MIVFLDTLAGVGKVTKRESEREPERAKDQKV